MGGREDPLLLGEAEGQNYIGPRVGKTSGEALFGRRKKKSVLFIFLLIFISVIIY